MLSNLRSSFKNKDLFDQALTHRSWINENKNVRESNERLEFLGDAILDYIVTKELYNKLPDKNEGFLTALRANIVNTKNLYKFAKENNLGEIIFLSKGEEEGRGRERESLLADTVEAIIGAIFIDLGIDKTEEFVMDNLLSDLDVKLSEDLKDHKSQLQEYCSANKLPAPKYKVVEETGPDHAKNFKIKVSIGRKSYGPGDGRSKREAEELAAKVALEAIRG